MWDSQQVGPFSPMLPRRALAGPLRGLSVAVGLMLVLAGNRSQVKPVEASPGPHGQGLRLQSPAPPLKAMAGLLSEALQLAVPPGLGAPSNHSPISTPAPSGPVSMGAITEDGVNLRSGPGTSYPIVAQLPAGVRAQVLGVEGAWYSILTPWGTRGWVAGDYFKPSLGALSGGQSLGSAGTVGMVNLRAGPGMDYPSYGLLDDGTVLEVLALQGDWYKVRSPRGTIGWVASNYVPLDWIPDVYGGSAPLDAGSSDVVRIAQKYLGARYVWGGSDPSGFDCSGFTWYVYRQVEVWLPGGSANQFDSQYGRYIGNLHSLAPGDLVFFERTTEEDGITHIGIYAGGGKMIAA